MEDLSLSSQGIEQGPLSAYLIDGKPLSAEDLISLGRNPDNLVRWLDFAEVTLEVAGLPQSIEVRDRISRFQNFAAHAQMEARAALQAHQCTMPRQGLRTSNREHRE